MEVHYDRTFSLSQTDRGNLFSLSWRENVEYNSKAVEVENKRGYKKIMETIQKRFLYLSP